MGTCKIKRTSTAKAVVRQARGHFAAGLNRGEGVFLRTNAPYRTPLMECLACVSFPSV
jgi:hypothetical protein